MKTIILLIVLISTISCKAQIYPLRTFTDVPENSYYKDTNNELQYYEGTWKGNWNNKIIYITFKKVDYIYISSIKEYRDMLIARFKVTDNNGLILFDNTNLSDNEVKIKGTRFRKSDDKYGFIYLDWDLCERSGNIYINFTDATKTQLQWKYSQSENWISSDCWYYNTPIDQRPQPLPNNIILTKQ